MKTKKYGGHINAEWGQYGDVCVRQSTGDFFSGSGNWYFVVNSYIRNIDTQTFELNRNKGIMLIPSTTLIINDTLRKEGVFMNLNNPKLINKCKFSNGIGRI